MAPLRVLLHAPTPGALDRARRNAANLERSRPDAEVLIIANAKAVAHALDTPDATDTRLRLCANSLAAQKLDNTRKLGEIESAVVTLADYQAKGWAYVRA